MGVPDAYKSIIVGAGAAVCRPSADPAAAVPLIDAGGNDRHPFIMPRKPS